MEIFFFLLFFFVCFFLFFFCPTILCPNWGRECTLLVSVVCLVGEVEVFVGIVVVVYELWRLMVV